jgi:putative cell wall-binding protein
MPADLVTRILVPVCAFLYQNNIILLLITKTSTSFPDFKTRIICVHLAEKSVSLSLDYTLKCFLIINITRKISMKAIPVPEHRIIHAYSSAELKRSYPRFYVRDSFVSSFSSFYMQ